MAKTPSLNVLIQGDPKALLAAFATSNAAAAGWATKMKAAMVSPPAIMAAAAVGVGAALFKIGADFDTAFDTIRVGTGATGEDLEGLKDSFKSVVKDVPTDFGSAGTAISELNTRLGLTGAPLEEMSKQVLELSRITETDLGGNIEAVSSVFQNWGTSVEEQGPKLDLLFRTSQATGISVSTLAGQMADSGVVLRQVGLDFDQSAALMGTLAKAGVDASDVMPALSRSLATAAKDGRSATDVFSETFAAIAGAPDDIAASQVALETFGSRAGPRLAGMIREGKLSYEELLGTVQGGGDTILGVAEETKDFGERLTELKNNVFVALEPVATAVFNAIGDGMKWVTDNASWLIPVVGGLVAAIVAVTAVSAIFNAVLSANPIALIVIAIAALVAGLVYAYNNFEGFRAVVESVWAAVQTAVDFAWNKVIKPAWDAIYSFIEKTLVPAFQSLWGHIKKAWAFIADAVSSAWNNVIKPVWDAIYWAITNLLIPYYQMLWNIVKTVFTAIAEVIGWAWNNVIKPVWDTIYGFIGTVLVPIFQFLWGVVSAVWQGVSNAISVAWGIVSGVFGGIKGGIASVATWIGDKVGSIIGFFTGLPGRIAGAVSGLWDGLTESFRNALNVIIGLWNGLSIPSFTIGGWDTPFGTLPSFTTPRIDFPDLPTFHEGGVFRAERPGGEGLAWLRDKELVLTPAQQNSMQSEKRSVPPVIVNVTQKDPDASDIGREILWAMKVSG